MIVTYQLRDGTKLNHVSQDYVPRVGEFVTIKQYARDLTLMKSDRYRVIEIETLVNIYTGNGGNAREIIITVSY